MNFTTDRGPDEVKAGQIVWHCYQRTFPGSLAVGMVVAVKKNVLVCIVPGSNREDAFHEHNRHVFTWRPTKGVWMEEGDSHPDPTSSMLLFAEGDAREAGRSPVFFDRRPDQILAIDITPEMALARWKAAGWSHRSFK